jgi:hypothetical protein
VPAKPPEGAEFACPAEAGGATPEMGVSRPDRQDRTERRQRSGPTLKCRPLHLLLKASNSMPVPSNRDWLRLSGAQFSASPSPRRSDKSYRPQRCFCKNPECSLYYYNTLTHPAGFLITLSNRHQRGKGRSRPPGSPDRERPLGASAGPAARTDRRPPGGGRTRSTGQQRGLAPDLEARAHTPTGGRGLPGGAVRGATHR